MEWADRTPEGPAAAQRNTPAPSEVLRADGSGECHRPRRRISCGLLAARDLTAGGRFGPSFLVGPGGAGESPGRSWTGFEEVRHAHLEPVSGIGRRIAVELEHVGRGAPIAVLPEGPMTIPYLASAANY